MKAGAYVLHITCDHRDCMRISHEFVGRNESEALKAARRAGWAVGRPWTAQTIARITNLKGNGHERS